MQIQYIFNVHPIKTTDRLSCQQLKKANINNIIIVSTKRFHNINLTMPLVIPFLIFGVRKDKVIFSQRNKNCFSLFCILSML